MNRIKAHVKCIADAHIQAKKDGKFDDPKVKTREELTQALKDGKTFSKLLTEIEMRYCNITSIIMSNHMDATTQSYRTGVYKGFKILLQHD